MFHTSFCSLRCGGGDKAFFVGKQGPFIEKAKVATKMPQTSKKAKLSRAKMRDSVTSGARKANGDVETIEGEDLYVIRVTNGDMACGIINKWIMGLPDDVDPNGMAIWATPK